MRAVDIILKKRNGQALSDEEINWFIQEYTNDNIPDYQTAALLMAIYFNGMSRQETLTLTMAMVNSGHTMDLSDISGYVVDKHSSGGVGDKTTLVVLPLVASFGVPIAKMSGRGLGFTGGTLDKLESIEGFNVNFSDDEFHKLAIENKLILAGQTGELAPADGKLYALRDVTGTVDNISLIASSIMSKKLASGANGIVLDVKLGSGAFMHDLQSARDLAREMTLIGVDAGRDVIALLSDMNQPLGTTVGNALEVLEAIETMQGKGAEDFVEHCLEIAAYMLQLAGQGEKWTNHDALRDQITEKLNNGEALAKFRFMVEKQGGDVTVVDNPDLLPQASIKNDILAMQSGFIEKVDANRIAQAALVLGAGREKKDQPIDHTVGVEILVNVGDEIAEGDVVARLHANDKTKSIAAQSYIQDAIAYSEDVVEPLPLFYGVIDGRSLD